MITSENLEILGQAICVIIGGHAASEDLSAMADVHRAAMDLVYRFWYVSVICSILDIEIPKKRTNDQKVQDKSLLLLLYYILFNTIVRLYYILYRHPGCRPRCRKSLL